MPSNEPENIPTASHKPLVMMCLHTGDYDSVVVWLVFYSVLFV